MSLLRAHHLVKRLGDRTVVDDVSFDVDSGQVLGLLGPNGAGKTTTMRMLYGFLRPDSGRITLHGQDLFNDLETGKRRMGVCTQDDTFDTDFSVRNNLNIAASYFRPRIADKKQHIQRLLERFDLIPFANHKPDTLSGGYRRRLMIARALINSPDVLFLDEPTTGLDPHARRSLWRLIDELRDDGLAIVLTTHYMDEAEHLADRLVVMQSGQVVANEQPRQVLGALVGEHVVVIQAVNLTDQFYQWWSPLGRVLPDLVLGEYHIPMTNEELSRFTAHGHSITYDVRKPNLDDLFVHLSGDD